MWSELSRRSFEATTISEKMSDGAGKAPIAFGRSDLSGEANMAIHFNHTILSAHDSKASAIFLAEMLNLPAPRRWGPFQVVVTENGANLDYMDTDGEITPQHYAFLISEAEFDEIFGRIRDRKLSYWADPGRRQLGEINHHDGGRGVY